MNARNMESLFDSEKAVEALIYVSDRVREHDMYLTLKTIYMAEKLHLERYGRMIIWDRYHALEYGPVPTRLYDGIRLARGDSYRYRLDKVENAIAVSANTIVRRRDPDYDVFSESDLECLDEAIRTYGRSEFDEIKDESHDEAYNSTPLNSAINFRKIALAAANGDESVLEHLEERYSI